MRIVINAGHTKQGVGTGASKYLNESRETRKIAYELMKLLANTDHIVIPAVYDVSSNNLKEAVTLSNNKAADLFISIHLNAGGGQGVEVYTWKTRTIATTKFANRICENINQLGFKIRGVKNGSSLYVIKHTKATAILIECCFVDSKEDATKYNAEAIAKAIYDAIKYYDAIK